MINIFCPNGISSQKIITKLARKEFGEAIGTVNSYVELKRAVIKVLKKLKPIELEENRLETLVAIKHIEENDFSKFISIRFAYWAMLLTIAVMLTGDVPIYIYFNMSKKMFGNTVMIILIFILVTMSRTMHAQHDELEYLNFKLICFDELIGTKKRKK